MFEPESLFALEYPAPHIYLEEEKLQCSLFSSLWDSPKETFSVGGKVLRGPEVTGGPSLTFAA